MSYHNNTSASGSGASEPSITYTSSAFVKEKDGVIAPLGFHFMDDGTLMSDAEHIRVNGYDEKTINSFTIDTKDIDRLGENKAFSIQGSGIFSLEISDSDGNYYNFNTQTWSTTKSGLYRVELLGEYSSSILFPAIAFTDATCDYNNDPTIAHDDDDGDIKVGMLVAGTGIPLGSTVATVTSDTRFELSVAATATATNETLSFSILKNFTINLFAETVENIQTSHAAYSEYAEADGSINVNKSTGSNSNLLKRIIYQDVVKNLYLSCIAPSLTTPSADTINQADGSANKIIIDGDATDKNVVRIGDKVTSGTDIPASVHALVTKINPDGDNIHEIEIGVTDTISNDDAITFTPPFNGMTPHSTDSTSGRHEIEASSGKGITTSFSITCTALAGRTFIITKVPDVEDLCAFSNITFGAAALAIPGEQTKSATIFHRWPITNIANISAGMILDPARSGFTSAPVKKATRIFPYQATTTSTRIKNNRYSTSINNVTLNDARAPAVDAAGNQITAIDRDGRATAQIGNITFDKQQVDALKADSGVRVFACGPDQIQSMTGVNVTLSNVAVTPTQVSTTTSGAVSGSATIGLAEAGNVSTAQTIRGLGINAAAANPTVAVKAAATGAVNITASVAQTLESGQTLFFDGASNIVTITGNITVSSMAITDTTLYFDVEKFLTAV